jgi:hypothetical protein
MECATLANVERRIRKMNYLGARENGPPVRDREQITPAAWQGIVGAIESALRTGLFMADFPDRSCVDDGMNEAITGCNARQFYLRLAGDHPHIPLPLNPDIVPETVASLELVEFCFRHASLPTRAELHRHFAHSHYMNFSRERGQEQLVEEINSILIRNHLAFELQPNGEVRRLIPLVLRDVLPTAHFDSEDADLNRLLESARNRFSAPDFRTRYDSLNDLFHAFERIKTLEPPREDKRRSSPALIARVSPEPQVQEMLDAEMRKLEEFGNGFFIRHANADQVSLQTSEEIDYLFHRLFAVIWLLLRKTGRGR